MTLESGDRVFFDITPTHMTLQLLERTAVGGEEDGVREGADTVVLHGKDVAVLLRRLKDTNDSGPVVVLPEGATFSDLSVSNIWNDSGAHRRVTLAGDENDVVMEEYECDMLVRAIESRVWRLFQ